MRLETIDMQGVGVRRETLDARMMGARHETLDASHVSRQYVIISVYGTT